MNSGFNVINFLILTFILSIGKVNSLLNFNYPSAISLSDGNIFIVEKEGIYVYDGELKHKIHSYTFQDENDKIKNEVDLSNVIIKAKGIYILCLINSKIFIFDYEGKYLSKTDKLISDANILHPTLTPIPLNNNDYYFYVIGYFVYEGGSYNMKLLYYKININTKQNSNINNYVIDKDQNSYWFFFSDDYPFQGMGLSLEYLQEEGDTGDIFLVCFFIVKKGDSYSLTQNYFKVSTDGLNMDDDYDSAFLDGIIIQINISQIIL